MKIVQSSWSCNQTDLLKFNAGWYAPEYHLMGWTLSCLQLTKYYQEVVLYADSATAAILIDKLRLPYTNVICDLDKLNNYHTQLWALPKIHTYSQQTSPFLHVDGDVMIWKPFDNTLLEGELIAQNIEAATTYYESMMKPLKERLDYLPWEIIKQDRYNTTLCSYNAGVFGGSDVCFFNFYANKAKEFINKNIGSFTKINVGHFNILFEQFLFHAMVRESGKKVNVLFDEVIGDNEYIGVGDFIEIPHNKQYLHLIGPYKTNKSVCEQMANRLRLDYPEYYYRIIALFKNKQAPLKKDYYYFIDQPTEKTLTERYNLLKNGHYSPPPANKIKNNSRSEITRFRIDLIQNVIASKRSQNQVFDMEKYTELLNDAKLFEDQLTNIVEHKFARYSNEYLYTRDILHTQYFQIIFEDKKSSHNKKLVVDEIIEIAETGFDWSRITLQSIDLLKVMQWPEELLPRHHTAIVPECDLQGYTLVGVDDLDLLLLEIMQKPINITEILDIAKSSFDATDLEESSAEYEQLIIGRLKLALESKIIKLHNDN